MRALRFSGTINPTLIHSPMQAASAHIICDLSSEPAATAMPMSGPTGGAPPVKAASAGSPPFDAGDDTGVDAADAGGLVIPPYVTNGGSFVSWLRSLEDPSINLSEADIDALVRTARSYGVSVYGGPTDLSGHPGTRWNRPHIHFGDPRIHIGVPPGYMIPP